VIVAIPTLVTLKVTELGVGTIEKSGGGIMNLIERVFGVRLPLVPVKFTR
jgi:hypothetical protein